MDSRIVVEKIWLTEAGTRINFAYFATGEAEKYFKDRPKYFAKYDIDLSSIPASILYIPLVANLAPIAWFTGSRLEISELDSQFIDSLNVIETEFQKNYPELIEKGASLIVGNAVSNHIIGDKTAMLFSGGVDAYTTFFRHRSDSMDLVSVWGADIPLNDEPQWQNLVSINAAEIQLEPYTKHHVQANLREIFNYHTNFLVKSSSWWGAVQHGLALNSLMAPLSFKFGYNKTYIASSYTDSIQILWGSTPEIDNATTWADVRVLHDGYELKRVAKIGLIVEYTNQSGNYVNLRVCYSELNRGLNCSDCEKCYRTILGLSLFGANPNKYGFKVDSSTYVRINEFINQGFKSEGARYFWWELQQRMLESDQFYKFVDNDVKKFADIKESLSVMLTKPVIKPKFSKIKMAIISGFPKTFALYISVRRLFQ